MNILEKLKRNHHPHSGALELLKYIGPGLLVTVGFWLPDLSLDMLYFGSLPSRPSC